MSAVKNVIKDNLNNVFVAELSASILMRDNIKYDKHNKS